MATLHQLDLENALNEMRIESFSWKLGGRLEYARIWLETEMESVREGMCGRAWYREERKYEKRG